MNISTALGRLRLLAILEGISYLLFAITMPLKYSWNIEEPNFVVGMLHGVLFVLYILQCLQVAYLYKWTSGRLFLSMLAAFIPVGTFIADARIFRPMHRNNVHR